MKIINYIGEFCYMNISLSYFVIAGIVIFCSRLGMWYTQEGLAWYATLNLPWYVPPNWVFSVVWTSVFMLTAAAVCIVWNYFPRAERFYAIMFFFVMNALLNVAWSYFFFYKHQIGASVIDAFALGISVFMLIIFIWPWSRSTALLLVPYAAWVSFAVYMDYAIWRLNA